MAETSRRDLPVRSDASKQSVGPMTWMFGLDKPGLIDRPQRWGIVPTFRFWNRIDTLRHQLLPVGLGLVTALPLSMLLTAALVPALGPWLAAASVIPLVITLGLLPLGLFERYLRKEIERRRGALPPADD